MPKFFEKMPTNKNSLKCRKKGDDKNPPLLHSKFLRVLLKAVQSFKHCKTLFFSCSDKMIIRRSQITSILEEMRHIFELRWDHLAGKLEALNKEVALQYCGWDFLEHLRDDKSYCGRLNAFSSFQYNISKKAKLSRNNYSANFYLFLGTVVKIRHNFLNGYYLREFIYLLNSLLKNSKYSFH